MKLYTENYPAPNPRKVRMYLAEKGLLDIPEHIRVNILERAHKTPEFLLKNSLGQLPVLQIDDGQYLCESLAICRYFEASYPEPALFGVAALEQAMIEMWIRRAEFKLWSPMAQVWINDDDRTAKVNPHQFKEYGALNRKHVANAMAWFNSEMSDGRSFLAGQFSMADIVLVCGLDFAKFVKMEIPGECNHLSAWHARMKARSSYSA